MKSVKTFIILSVIAVCIKLALFLFAEFKAPSAKFLVDSNDYILTAQTLAETGVFARPAFNGRIDPEFFRTPGYPLFLTLFHFMLKVSFRGIILIQIVLTLLAAFFTMKAADLVDERLTYLTGFIMLLDPAITVYSLLILTESLFLFFMSLFLFFFVRYCLTHQLKWLIFSAIILGGAVYIRPISFYLGVFLTVCLVVYSYRLKLENGLSHGLIFLIIVYSLTGIWQARNYKQFKDANFSSVTRVIIQSKGLYKSYERFNENEKQKPHPAAHYGKVLSKSLLTLFTRPASLKYFLSRNLKKAGKLASYPFITFWFAGFLVGGIMCWKNSTLGFVMSVVLYFTCATVAGALWEEGPRFRVAMMPFIALISAYGWSQVLDKFPYRKT